MVISTNYGFVIYDSTVDTLELFKDYIDDIASNFETIDAVIPEKIEIADIMSDWVVSGLLPAEHGSSLTSSISAGYIYIDGVRIYKNGTPHTYTASKDTYVDIDPTGTYVFSEVPLDDPEPTLTEGNMRLAKVVTDATTIPTVVDMRTLEYSLSKNDKLNQITWDDPNLWIGAGSGGELFLQAGGSTKLTMGAHTTVSNGYFYVNDNIYLNTGSAILKGRDSGAASVNLLQMDASVDKVKVGTTSYPLMFNSSVEPIWYNGTTEKSIIFEAPNDGEEYVRKNEAWAIVSEHAINDITDIVITSVADNEILQYDNGSGDWINQTLAEAGISATGHSHVATDVTDFDTEVSNNTSVSANTDKISFDATASAKVAWLTVTQAVDLDTIETDTSSNNSHRTTTTGNPHSLELADLDDVDSTVGSPTDGKIMVYRTAGGDWILEDKPASGSTPSLDELTDVTITGTPADDEVLAYNTGTNQWINQTAAEAGLAISGHSHTATDVTDFDTEVSNNTSVSANTSKISFPEAPNDGEEYVRKNLAWAIATGGGASAINDLTDVVISGTPADNEVLAYDTSSGDWINQTPGEAGLSASGHGHTASNISDFDTEVGNHTDVTDNTTHSGTTTGNPHSLELADLSNVVITSVGDNDIIGYDSGGNFINQTASELGLSVTGHSHVAIDVTDFDTEVANNTAVAANTDKISFDATASAKVAWLTVTQAVDLDTMESNISTNNGKVTNADHTGEVTGSGALTIADNVVDEANLKLETGPTNDYVLTADSTKSGGMKWAAAPGGGGAIGDLSDVTISSIGNDEILVWETDEFVNQTFAEAGIGTATDVATNRDDVDALFKIKDGVTTGSAIAITTDGTFDYVDGRWIMFKADANITAPATIAIDGGSALTAKDKDGNNIDIVINITYLCRFVDDTTDFFELAPKETILAGGYQKTYEASGTVNSGDMVDIDYINETATAVSERERLALISQNLLSATDYDYPAIAKLTSTTFLFIGQDDVTGDLDAFVCTHDGERVTSTGTVLEVSGDSTAFPRIKEVTSTTFLVTFINLTGTDFLSAIMLSVSGTTVTKGTAVSIDTFTLHPSNYHESTILESTKALVTYADKDDTNALNSVVLTISGLALTVNTIYTHSTNSCLEMSLVTLSSTRAFLASPYDASGDDMWGYIIDVSGTVVTYTDDAQIDTDDTGDCSAIALSSTSIALLYRSNTTDVVYFVLVGITTDTIDTVSTWNDVFEGDLSHVHLLSMSSTEFIALAADDVSNVCKGVRFTISGDTINSYGEVEELSEYSAFNTDWITGYINDTGATQPLLVIGVESDNSSYSSLARLIKRGDGVAITSASDGNNTEIVVF